jgi:acetyltransferase-like isoleucine patch superfamily enzyme
MPSPTLRSIGIVDVRFGVNVIVVQPANLYGCEIGDNSFVGPFVEVQKNVRIGAHCRIQSHVFVCEKVTIGDHCFVSHGAMFVNDLFRSGKPTFEAREWGETVIGDHVLIGTHATILPVRICAHAVIGAGAVVTRDIREPGIYAGNPARLVRPLAAAVSAGAGR